MHSLADKDFALLYPQWQQIQSIRQQLDPHKISSLTITPKIWGLA